MPLRQNEGMLAQRRLNSRDGGQDGEDCGAAHLDGPAVAMVHPRVATAGRAHGGRLLRHTTHWPGMTQRRPGEWPELKQKKQRREHPHGSIVALALRRDKRWIKDVDSARASTPNAGPPLTAATGALSPNCELVGREGPSAPGR